MRNIIIIGGGIAGLATGIQVARAGISCLLVEKKSYPLHRVCGEYISNEAVPFLKRNGLYPSEFSPSQINRFELSSVTGRKAEMKLDMGGFGISRFTFDNFLFEKARSSGVTFLLNTEVTGVHAVDGKFQVKTASESLEGDLVVGTFGKRSRLDVAFNRGFIKKRSPYVGIKYHIRTDHPQNLIALHNFRGGYCGISNIEEGKTNLCYLTHRNNVQRHGDIQKMEKEVLSENPFLRRIFSDSEFLFNKPEVINEISFETKSPIENHILMAGDAAGMIAPLCGNGMAMALHASMLLSSQAIAFCCGGISRETMEKNYSNLWQRKFRQRLWNGRNVQRLFGTPGLSNVAVDLARNYRPVADFIMRNTHGEIF